MMLVWLFFFFESTVGLHTRYAYPFRYVHNGFASISLPSSNMGRSSYFFCFFFSINYGFPSHATTIRCDEKRVVYLKCQGSTPSGVRDCVCRAMPLKERLQIRAAFSRPQQVVSWKQVIGHIRKKLLDFT